MLFVTCVDSDGEIVLISLSDVLKVLRHYRDERADVIVTSSGEMYTCFDVSGDNLYPSIGSVLTKIGG